MGESAAELRQDIEETRLSMSRNADAIGDRVLPGRILERRRNRVRAGWASMRHRVMGVPSHMGESVGGAMTGAGTGVRDEAHRVVQKVDARTEGNPFGAGLVAFGIGMLAAQLVPPSQAERELATKARDKAQPLMEPVQEAAEELIDLVKAEGSEALGEVRRAGTEAAEAVGHTAKDRAGSVRDQARS